MRWLREFEGAALDHRSGGSIVNGFGLTSLRVESPACWISEILTACLNDGSACSADMSFEERNKYHICHGWVYFPLQESVRLDLRAFRAIFCPHPCPVISPDSVPGIEGTQHVTEYRP